MIVDMASWYSKMYSQAKIIDKVTASELADITNEAILNSGKIGFLYEVRIYSNAAGQSKMAGEGLIPVGPGDDPVDALANSMLNGPSFVSTVDESWGSYDNNNSFFVFSSRDENGNLQAKSTIWPLHTYLMAQKRVFSELTDEKLASDMASRASAYKNLSDHASKVAKSNRTRLSIRSLQRARDIAAADTLRAYRHLKEAHALQKSADSWNAVSSALGIIGEGISAINKSIEIEGPKKQLDGAKEKQTKIEIELNIEIKKVLPKSTPPKPVKMRDPG